MGQVLERTVSLCPESKKLVPAEIIEEDGNVYMVKECPEGTIKERLGTREWYNWVKKFEKFTPPTTRNAKVHVRKMERPCPFSCGLCPAHISHTALLNLVVTNRCDLRCPYCFFYAEKANFVYEPGLFDLLKQVQNAMQEDVPLAVQLTGGEPTLREDLPDIMRALREMGVAHVQLNTHGIKFARLFLESPEKAIEYARTLSEAGMHTIYISFDGVTPKTNPKNYWEMPLIMETFRRVGYKSVVLVPTLIRNLNLHEAWNIVKYAIANMDVVRGVNFQPVSFTGLMPRELREKERVTISDLIEVIDEQSGGQIELKDWYPVPVTVAFSKFIEALYKDLKFEMTNHPACGVATYVYVEDPKRFKVVPITRIVDVEGRAEYLYEKAEEVKNSKLPKKLKAAMVLAGARKFIDLSKFPEVGSLLVRVFTKGTYEALAEFHMKFLYLGTMHFMDLYNFDVKRVMRCNIHYSLPDGRVIPFCAYNNLPELYREVVLKKYSVSVEEAKKLGKWNEPYVRDIKQIKEVVAREGLKFPDEVVSAS